jgi:hypothetical protein
MDHCDSSQCPAVVDPYYTWIVADPANPPPSMWCSRRRLLSSDPMDSRAEILVL